MDPANNNNNFETNFGLDIFTNLLNSDGTTDGNDKNLIISPFLVEALLALLYLGSDGKTAEELKAKLHIQRFPNNAKMASYFAGNLAAITQNSPDTQLEICSKIFVDEQHDLDMEFQKIAYKYFLTQTEKQNLQHTKNIEDLLKNCLQENLKKSAINFKIFQENCKALLLMAANFRNKWFLPFSAYRSGLYDFHVSSDCVKSIPMMLDNEMFVKFVELKEMDARAIELPYEHDDEISMLIILPNKRDGLAELETKLKQVNLSTIAEQMQMESVQLLLPKFQIDFECSLKAVLEKLGFSLLFGEDSNFKNLLSPQSASSSLPIADILHKVCLDVHESGSESSNVEATKPIVISNSIDTRQKFFRADHPFFFAIRNRDATYFMGHVVKF
ncbi:serine protease inhibitor 42Dd [Musca vetustissima]|uniref:serine protease inhibitor 42Dd n=1 Tax=Musca vetustissima TaxID=27455 RepID=UPI002AB7D660|nr:serine protease inhibitor 42Dd [Musca vetustissima]